VSGRPLDGARRTPARPSRQWPDRVTPTEELAARLNREWRLAAPDVSRRTIGQRVAQPLRLALAVLLRPQRAFNSTVVQHLNFVHETTSALRQMIEDVFFRTEVLFDRMEAAEARLEEVDTLLDDLHRSREMFLATERRVADAVGAMRDEHAQIRTAVGVLRHETQHLSKALASAGPAVTSAPSAPAVHHAAAGSPDALTYRYVGFEDEFRGSQDAVRARLAGYVPLFAGASDVLDIGCGRGEFLSLLAASGITGRGIDLNETMVEVCRERGFPAEVSDALDYLRRQPDASLGGLFAAQVVEHLQPGYLTQLIDLAFDKLRPGAVIVLETINPACWFAFFSSYIRDITHERALHPDTLKFLLVASGFERVEIRYSAPYPEHEKLQPVTAAAIPPDAAETLNANVEKINRLLFTYLDYAALGRRP
jgi:2-polyprenyl-3-methyl-5-hydroxy-6-metoxy-1,4-benzoquinol methylase